MKIWKRKGRRKRKRTMSKGKGRRGQQDSPTLWVAVGGILANILTQEQTV